MELNVNTLLNEQLSNIVSRDIITLEADKPVSIAIKAMRDRDARSALVIHSNEAVGIVTKTDILFKVIAQNRDPNKVKLREIMSSPVIMLPASAKVSDALDIMNKHVIRQVFVGSSTAIVGMVSREELFEMIHKASINTSEDALSGAPVCIINPKASVLVKDVNKQLQCPYCESSFTYKDELSRHIDRLHMGSGALEGDLRRIFE
ncbi:MAG: hypothetical protein KatS3mg003_2088 [Candidatus Nitrosocaldaceae archaeon]|nr:MAG: hypothetical protein KatS3mg003_2088 [Candidatus Nitrosocaldaceae archaeon]